MEEFTRSEPQKSIQLCILLLMNGLAICGNIFVCWAVYRKRKVISVPYLYVLALAISDLSVMLLCFPFNVRAFVADRWVYSDTFCQFNGFFHYFWAGISVPTLALTAINRYFRVVRANIYRKYFTLKSSLIMIASVWAFTLFDGLIGTFAGSVVYTYNHHYFFCVAKYPTRTKEKAIGLSLTTIHVLLPLLIIVFCYSKVFFSVRTHNKNVMPALRAGQGRDVAMNAWEMRVTRLLFLVLVGFVVCWTPVMVIGFMARLSTNANLPNFAFEMYTFFAFGSAVINPVIYGVANRAFRREFLSIVRCK